ncbi:NAD(P)/FAD-dependent oxidoreductase [Actinomadura livida]|uniref:FAD-dependent oxidoreductase n=1 Tax=Actinomadura livida TaxID=79909 RepID=A0A7W7ICJ9_9ACTN|nr:MULTISPECIES: FAD-dependent oxidoreductase [Actinomadura]MBB4774228.1 NADPH-dependent 2,4-dienoyl-CoA reductase/sulfur reductase-like enzyme [Actinomadura catellatispora]GGT84040.1 putative ferredoxin reductase [Actinomadura livida]
MTGDVVIVGASVAGVALARTLRSSGFTGRVRLVDRETEEPYDKPPLSKGRLEEPVRLLTRPEAERLGLELLLGVEATGLDTAARRLALSDGSRIGYGALVIATGVRARRSPWIGPGVHVLRTLADARALHADLAQGGDLVVVGAGFIGAEVASTAIDQGCRVTLVDPLTSPPARVVGQSVGDRILTWHERAGVNLRLGRVVEALDQLADGISVRLDDGEVLRADHVVVGIGAEVDVDWLAGSGLHLEDGIACDPHGRALGADDVGEGRVGEGRVGEGRVGEGQVFAAGDVARWAAADGAPGRRIEHWNSAQEQARCIAATLLDPERPQSPSAVPMVWSDQHGRTVQVLGAVDPGVEPRLVEDGDRLLALWDDGGRVTGAVSLGWPRGALAARRAIANGAAVTAVVDTVAPREAAR